MRDFKLPTEVVELPSKGVLYEETNPLSKGTIDIKYPTAKEEDILSNINYIQDGSVFNRFYESLVESPIKLDDLYVGDKNALMVAVKILAHGKIYKFNYNGKKEEVDLTQLKNKEVDLDFFNTIKTDFPFHLPHLKVDITFKLLTSGEEDAVVKEIKGLQEAGVKNIGSITTRFKHIITSVDGDRDKNNIRKFVDNYFLSQDIKALRDYINQITPNVDLTFFPGGTNTPRPIPFGIEFLWGND